MPTTRSNDGDGASKIATPCTIHDDDERARRPADLDPRDGEGDREGQRDDADDYAGGGVGDELPAGVAAEGGDELGDDLMLPDGAAELGALRSRDDARRHVIVEGVHDRRRLADGEGRGWGDGREAVATHKE